MLKTPKGGALGPARLDSDLQAFDALKSDDVHGIDESRPLILHSPLVDLEPSPPHPKSLNSPSPDPLETGPMPLTPAADARSRRHANGRRHAHGRRDQAPLLRGGQVAAWDGPEGEAQNRKKGYTYTWKC